MSFKQERKSIFNKWIPFILIIKLKKQTGLLRNWLQFNTEMSLQTQSVNLMMVLEEKLGKASNIELSDDVYVCNI